MPSRASNQQVSDLIGPICKLLEHGAIASAEASIAALVLWVLDCIESARMHADMADEAFTLLVVYASDRRVDSFGEDVQELLFEAQHLHHWRDPVGPDPKVMRALAESILARSVGPTGARPVAAS